MLLYQIGSAETRMLVDVPNGLPEAAPAAGGVRGYIANTVLPTLPAHVRPAVAAALAADGRIPRSMPNSWLPPTRQTRPQGAVLAGDALNMRHPLTGGGMTVALSDAVLLADLLRPARVPDLADAAAVRRRHGRLPLAPQGPHLQHQRARPGPVQPLRRPRPPAARPAARLLRLLPARLHRRAHGPHGRPHARPAVLFSHFFTVAFLAIWLNARDLAAARGPLAALWTLPLALADAVLILWKAIVVFVPVLWRELQ